VTVVQPNPADAAVLPVLPDSLLQTQAVGGGPPEEPEDLRGWGDWPTPPWLEALGRWAAAIAGAFIVFGAVLLANGADPARVMADAFDATFTENASLQQILIKATPFALAALAVVVPARAGLVNVGGEGQVLVGAIAAAGVGLWYDQKVMGDALLIVMFLAAAIAGALWAGIAAVLRLTVKVNEAISTLLLNFIAIDLLLYLIYDSWKDPYGSGQPATRPLADRAKLEVFRGSMVNVGLVVAVVAAFVVLFLLVRTSWGFKLSVVGGNPEAARRAGMPVALLLLSAMLVGGALAGLAGAIQFSGVEYKLRPNLTANIGYIAFLISWLARHRPIPVLLGSLAFAAITVAGDSFQIDSGLPSATVNILTGLILVAVLGWTGPAAKRKKARA
jgi:simple sugar transport system permease protein